MLTRISWTSFFVVLALILVGYYLYVVFVFFRKDLLFFFAGNKKQISGNTRFERPANNTTQLRTSPASGNTNESDESFTIVHELLEELKEIFMQAARAKMVKEELIQAIRSAIHNYPKIAETDLVEDIKTHIVLEAKDKCAVDISPEDLKQIWSI